MCVSASFSAVGGGGRWADCWKGSGHTEAYSFRKPTHRGCKSGIRRESVVLINLLTAEFVVGKDAAKAMARYDAKFGDDYSYMQPVHG